MRCSNSDIYFPQDIHITFSQIETEQLKFNILKWISKGNLWIITVDLTCYCGWSHGEPRTKVPPHTRGLNARETAEELVIDLRAHKPELIPTNSDFSTLIEVLLGFRMPNKNIVLLLFSIGLLMVLIIFRCIVSVWFNTCTPDCAIGCYYLNQCSTQFVLKYILCQASRMGWQWGAIKHIGHSNVTEYSFIPRS